MWFFAVFLYILSIDNFSLSGYLKFSTINQSLHRLLPKNRDHLLFLGKLRTKNTLLLFWNGIGGLNEDVEIAASLVELHSNIPMRLLTEMDWEIKYQEFRIFHRKEIPAISPVMQRSMARMKSSNGKKRARGKKRATVSKSCKHQVRVVEIPRTKVYTGRFYNFSVYPNAMCYIGVANDDTISCYRNNTDALRKQINALTLWWGFQEFQIKEGQPYYVIRSRKDPNRFISYNITRGEFVLSRRTKVDTNSLFKIFLKTFVGFHPVCTISTKSNRVLTLGYGGTSEIQIVEKNPLFPEETEFIFDSNEFFQSSFRKAFPDSQKYEKGETVGVAGGQVINRSKATIVVEFTEIDTTYTEKTTRQEVLNEQALTIGVDASFFEVLGVSYKYEKKWTETNKTESTDTDKREVENVFTLTVGPERVVKYSRYWSLSKEGTVYINIELKIDRKENFMFYKKQNGKQEFCVKMMYMPLNAVLDILNERNTYDDVNFEIIEQDLVFKRTVPVDGVSVISSKFTIFNESKGDLYEVDCINEVLPGTDIVKTKTTAPPTKLIH